MVLAITGLRPASDTPSGSTSTPIPFNFRQPPTGIRIIFSCRGGTIQALPYGAYTAPTGLSSGVLLQIPQVQISLWNTLWVGL
ncbi:hypothetical protein XELAEV_18004319mg [Xenopus laevis]|uniref:Uncharacterized protein n=1 Tax=Xenopus laevis TaxID=8355 RepID=A0A974BRU5_XENLA|nr:hypothetical protein XELAEV_18004319mg [Xenopus laevis]